MPRKKNIPAGDPYWRRKYEYQKATGENKENAKRMKSLRIIDKAGIDRTGKDVDHKKPLRSGGSIKKSNLRLRDPAENRGDNGHHPGEKAGKKFKK